MGKTNKKIQQKELSRREMLKKTGLVMAAAPFYFGLDSCISAGGKKSFDADVIIIGAGLSGLNAALTLEEAGYSVKIIEATNRIGGRVFSADVPGNPEMGANGIGGGYARLINAANKYDVEITPYYTTPRTSNDSVYYHLKNQNIRLSDWPKSELNPFHEGFREGHTKRQPWKIYGKLNPLPDQDLTAWRSSDYTQWDKSVYEVLKQEGFSDEAIHLAIDNNPSYGRGAKDISVLMFFQILNFISNQSQFKTGGGTAVGGNQSIPKAMGKAFKQDIIMQSPVASVSGEADGVDIKLENGKKFRSRYCLVTLPASALRNIDITKPENPIQHKGFQELQYTPVMWMHFVPKREFWKEDGLPIGIWTDELFGGLIAYYGERENPEKLTTVGMGITGNKAIQLSKMGKEKAIALATQTLERVRPSTKGALELVQYWDWIDNPHAGGSYAYWQPGQITEFSNELAKPVGRIHFAGEHTAVVNRGMEGAMESGEREAFNLLDRMG